MVSIIQTKKSTDYQAIANDVAQTLADSAIERDRLGVNIHITLTRPGAINRLLRMNGSPSHRKLLSTI